MSVRKFRVVVDGQAYQVEVEEIREVAGAEMPLPPPRDLPPPAAPRPKEAAPPPKAADQTLKAPLQGTVLSIPVQAGQAVQAGQVLVVIEAMKMENEIVAPAPATVSQVHVKEGDVVAAGDLLVSFS